MNAFRILGAAAGAVFLLAACGGGSSDQSLGPGPSGSLFISAERDSVEANPREVLPDPDSPHTVQVTVRFTNPSGGFVADGTPVNLTSNSVALGVVSPINNPTATGNTATSTTAAGSARFWFTAGNQTGTVSLDASANDPTSGRTITASLQLNVVPFAGDPDRVSVEVAQTSLPANAFEFEPGPGSPFSTQVNVTALGSDGEPVADGTDVSLGVDNVNRGRVSPADNPTLLGATAVAQTVGGVARFLLTSGTETGPLTLLASFIDADPNTGEQATYVSPPLVFDIEPFDPDIERITVSAVEGSLPANVLDIQPSINSQFSTQVNVDVLTQTGGSVPDGTQVSIGVNNLALASVAPLENPSASGATATASTVGGSARFLVTSGRDTGTVALVASDVSANVVGEPFELTILPNNFDDARLRISGPSVLPANPQGVPIFLGSPFINELTVEYLGPDGQPGDVAEGEIAVAIAPVNVGAYSTLDDPETEDVNEFLVLVGSGPVNMAAGVTTLFVHSFDQPGTVTVTAVAVDATTGERFSAKFDVEVIDGGADFLPSQFDFSVSPEPVYVQGSGGATNKSMQLIVNDSGGNPVPNPEVDGNAWNNVRLELDAPAGSGARLVGTGSEGPVNGTDIAVQSVNGIVNFTMNAGTETGPHRVIATADRADNNVDNDIIDPLQAEMTVEVGDGQLFSLTLISPILNAISVNPTTSGVETSFSADLDPVSGALIPTDPDGTYSLTITAQGTDKVGNPVLPGTRVDFGKIDDPLTPGQPRFFVFSGPDGDPQEGGTLFSVFDPLEDFLDDPIIVDEAVEPGDTVALFGKAVPGNREHEAVRIVQDVIDDNTVVVTEPFNRNDPTGAIVDDGFAIPWVIGRSQIGTIDQTVELNADGRGSVQLTYPLSQLGRRAVLWTQGTRVEQPNNKTVADVASSVFPGLEPLLLTAQPSVIQANEDSVVRLCLTDALGSPIQGVFINGGITDGPATGQLDGVPMTTSTANATGTDGAGCVNTVVTTSGLVPDGDSATITFFFDEAEAQVQVVPPGAASLEVLPSRVSDPTLAFYEVSLLLTLRDGMGDPISGVDLTGECNADEGTLEISGQPGVTDVDGEAIATVLIGLTACGDGTGEGFPRLAQCTFTTPSGVPIGLFTAIGSDARLFTQSPGLSCPPLEDPPDTAEFEMIVEDNRPAGSDSLIQSIPTGIACDAAASASDNALNCSALFNVGTTVILRAPTGSAPTWAGACTADPNDPRFASVEITGGDEQLACLAEFN